MIRMSYSKIDMIFTELCCTEFLDFSGATIKQIVANYLPGISMS